MAELFYVTFYEKTKSEARWTRNKSFGPPMEEGEFAENSNFVRTFEGSQSFGIHSWNEKKHKLKTE